MRALERFSPADGAAIAAWVTSLEEASRWASMTTLPDAAALERWHTDPDVVPFVGREAGVLVAYGEVWEDRDEDEAELARLLVAPGARGRGIGRWLARALADEAHARGFADVWLRVVPDNEPALHAYAHAGFLAVAADQEQSFNVGQRVAYRWLRDGNARPA